MGMKIRIERVYEYADTLRVEVEHDYGKDNIGLSLRAKYLDPETGKPRWQKEVKELLEKKYGKRMPDNSIQKEDQFAEWHGQECDLDCLDRAEVKKGKVVRGE